jgi:hypothetical protein
MSPRAGVLLGVISALVLVLGACFGGSGNEAGAPSTSREASSASTSTAGQSNAIQTAPQPPTTATETAESSGTQSTTVTEIGDVPTTTEVGTDVLPKSAPPWHKELAVCNTQSVRVVFNPNVPAILVMRDDRVLAWAGLYRRDVSDECRNVPRHAPVLSSEIPQGIYETVELRCNAPGRIQIDARPIESHGSVNGSIVVLDGAGTNKWFIAAIVVNEVEGRRVYVNSTYCTRS